MNYAAIEAPVHGMSKHMTKQSGVATNSRLSSDLSPTSYQRQASQHVSNTEVYLHNT